MDEVHELLACFETLENPASSQKDIRWAMRCLEELRRCPYEMAGRGTMTYYWNRRMLQCLRYYEGLNRTVLADFKAWNLQMGAIQKALLARLAAR
jgi:hypothetical protein